MNRHSLRWGATASGALTGSYVAVVGASGGWEHLVDQARTDWWLLAPIILAFGTQVALSVELRRRRHAQHLAGRRLAHLTHSPTGAVSCAA